MSRNALFYNQTLEEHFGKKIRISEQATLRPLSVLIFVSRGNSRNKPSVKIPSLKLNIWTNKIKNKNKNKYGQKNLKKKILEKKSYKFS